MLTKGMAIDWGQYGIQVNGLGPGYFKTELTEALVNNEEFSRWLIARTPSRRWGDVEDLVGAGDLPGQRGLELRQRPYPVRRWRCDRNPVIPEQARLIMDALVIHAPGDLRVESIATPALQSGQLRVRVRAGGICGSDLHYFQHGGFGTVRIKEPMVLGHEVAGVIEEVAPDATGFAVGQRIAISPSRPCGLCRFCQRGLQNHCLDMRYYGSAMRTPHVQGAFRQEIVVETSQAHLLAEDLSDNEGAMAEPLSVALHAVRRAGPLLGQRVLVTGCGPIGALLVIAARRAGAAQIVVTDIGAYPLRKALQGRRGRGDQRRGGSRAPGPLPRGQGPVRRSVRGQRQ